MEFNFKVQSLSINSHIEPHNQGLMLFKDIFIYVFDITRSMLTVDCGESKREMLHSDSVSDWSFWLGAKGIIMPFRCFVDV